MKMPTRINLVSFFLMALQPGTIITVDDQITRPRVVGGYSNCEARSQEPAARPTPPARENPENYRHDQSPPDEVLRFAGTQTPSPDWLRSRIESRC
jgi:hypothetical protein